jgi:hypothetical protein
VTVIKVLCDTDTLFHNIDGTDEKSTRELQALRRLFEMRTSGRLRMYRSQVNRVELANFDIDKKGPEKRGEREEKRDKLEADYMALDPVAKEENVSGFQYIPSPTGSFTSNPVSDLDSADYKECRARGLCERDTLHILRAVDNACDVFLTRDGKIIGRRDWLEKEKFPGRLKIRLPSELVGELRARPASPT